MIKKLIILLILSLAVIACGAQAPDNPVVDARGWSWDPDPCTENGTQFYRTYIAAENEDPDFRDNFVDGDVLWYVYGDSVKTFRTWWARVHPDRPLNPNFGGYSLTYRDGHSELWTPGKKIDGKIWFDPRISFEEFTHRLNFLYPGRIADPHEWFSKIRPRKETKEKDFLTD